MDKFWKWMEEKNYSYLKPGNDPCYFIRLLNGQSLWLPFSTQQMMIGYMLEYIVSNADRYMEVDSNKSVGDAIWDKNCYSKLEEIIKEMDEK